MSDPVTLSVPLIGDGVELQVIGAICRLLDLDYFDMGGSHPLEPIEKDRIVRYLFDRYTISQTRSE